MFENNYFYHCICNDELYAIWNSFDPIDTMKEIIVRFEKEIEIEKNNHNKIIDEQKQKLKQYVLNDPDFILQTAIRLRREYTIDLFKNKLGNEFNELREYWTNQNIPAYIYGAAVNFIELIWKEYKMKNKNH